MYFSTLAVAAFVAIPSLASAFSLANISNDIGQVNSKCESQFDIPLMSCPVLPGKCSEACKQQLEALETTLLKACKDAESPSGLLLTALNGDLVEVLCSGSDGTKPTPVASETGPVTFNAGPGKSAEPTAANSELTFSGVVQANSAEPEATGLITDTSVPDSGASQTVAFPENTYSPTTLKTTSSPSQTSGSGDSSNGGLFTSQEDAPSGAGAIRAGFLGLAVGVIAIVVNIA